MNTILPQAVCRRTKTPAELPSDLRLRALEWALYFAVSGKHTAAELGRLMSVDSADSGAALTHLMRLGLIEEQDLNASEYVRALVAAEDGREKTLHEFLLGPAQLAVPSPPAAVESLAAPSVAEEAKADNATTPAVLGAFRLPAGIAARSSHDTIVVRQPRALPPSFGFKPLPPLPTDAKEKRPMSVPRQLSIRALMNLIERHSGTREGGQLDVYRVFVRVDTKLLKRNGIDTLRFTEDRLISDPELEKAIVSSVKKTLGLDCPQSVWVDAA